jgi:hypothetical protein
LRDHRLLLFSEDTPTRDAGNDQNASSDGEQSLLPSRPVGRLKLQEITVTGAAGAKVIEPLFRFGQRHFARGDSFENVRAWTPDTVRIRILFE